jgi:2-polyprenyl-6-methoxyphenol hydroxylase-like FAD-dependent oxidoreductase
LCLGRSPHAPIPQLIQATTEHAILRNDIYDRPPLKSWGRGLVSLLGDAAHPMTPNLGQGACQAIEDAVVLGRAIATHSTVSAALRSYEAQRIDRANLIVTQSRQIGWVGQWRHPMAVALRNALVRFGGSRLQARQLALIGRLSNLGRNRRGPCCKIPFSHLPLRPPYRAIGLERG